MFFVIDNLFIDFNEVGLFVSDAIESPNITSYEFVSSSTLMHSPYTELESIIVDPNIFHEECRLKLALKHEVDALELMLEGNGVYDEETLAVVSSFDTKILHHEPSLLL